MKIVEKNEKLIEEMQKYRYAGFLSYLMVNSEEMRNLFVSQTLHVYDIISTMISNEKTYDNMEKTYDMKIEDSQGTFYDFKMILQREVEDMVFSIELMIDIDSEDVLPQFHKLIILCDSDDDCFPKYIQELYCFKKNYYLNNENGELLASKSLEFQLVYELDHILDNKKYKDFDEIMYLIKFNEELEGSQSKYVKMFKQMHQEYLNSNDFITDYQWEVDNYKEDDVS